MQLADLLPVWLRKSTSGSILGSSDVLREMLRSGGASKSGASVTWQTAMRVSTYIACARVIADGLAQVPLKLYRQQGDRREPATDHPLYDVLNLRPNEWQTSLEYIETIALHLVFTGNHHSFVNRVRGQITELIPLEPGSVETRLADDGMTLRHRVRTAKGQVFEYPADAIWHVKGPSWNGWLGLDTVRQAAREAVGLAIATEEAHALLHANGVQTTGTLSVEGTLTPEQHKQLTAHLAKNAGAGRGLPMIVDRAAKWLQQGMSGVDAQHLETRRFQVEEICRALRVMPIMVGSTDKASTYASAEQMFLAHVVHTLSPWYRRLEQSIDAHLLSPADRRAGVYSKFVVNALLRGSMKDRGDFYAKALGAGGSPAWLTQDEVRGLEELNPMGGAAAVLPIATNLPKQGARVDDPAPEPAGA